VFFDERACRRVDGASLALKKGRVHVMAGVAIRVHVMMH